MGVFRTAVLLAGMTALFLAVGFALGGKTGMMVALIAAAGMNLFSWWGSDRMVLGIYGAREVDAATAPDLYRMTKALADRAGLPMPKLYLIDSDQPNAFATGRDPDHAAVAVNTGLVRMLSREEVEGVIAHELAHIKNRDTLLMTVTATIAGAISMLANFGFLFGGNRDGENRMGGIAALAMMILAPIGAMIVQMAISRTREYEADRVGAEISGKPLALGSALARISNAAHDIENVPAENNPATAHMFIINPLSGARMDNLFSTHPATENRIAALREIAQMMGDRARPVPRSALAMRSRPAEPAEAEGPWGRRVAAAEPERGPWG